MSRTRRLIGAAVVAAITLPAATTVTHAHNIGRYHNHQQNQPPRVNDNGVVCRMKLTRKCTTYRGKTYCKPTWERVCRQVTKTR